MAEKENNEMTDDAFIPDDIEPAPDLDPDGTIYNEPPIKDYWKNGVYISSINKTIPEDAVELTKEQYETLLNSQDSSHTISTGEDGMPFLEEVDNSGQIAIAEARAAYMKLRAALEMKTTQRSIDINDDATALSIAPICAEWEASHHYEAGEIVNHEGQAYRVIQKVDSLAHQPPGAEGMLAIYRPLNPGHAGTQEDPIPYTYGMDVYNGKYYSYNEKTYLAKADMLPCVWDPGTAGLWQWEEVMSEPEGSDGGQ